MPATEEAPLEQKEEPFESVREQRSSSFNTMAEKLSTLLKPFHEAPKEPEPDPAKTPEVKPAVTSISLPKPPEKKEEAPPQDQTPKPEEELPESIRKSPKASEEFKKIRTTAQQFKAESEKHATTIKDLEEQLTKLKTAQITPVLPSEFDSLKKEHEELSNQLKIVNIERHPSFRSHFEGRNTSAIEKAKAVLGPEITEKAAKLANLPPSEYRAEQLDKMILETQETSPSKAVFLTDLIRDINSISYDKENAIKKARDDYDVVQKHDQEKASAAQAEQVKQKNEFIAAALASAKDLEAFRRGDDAKVNTAVDERENFVKSLLNGEVDPKLLPYIPVLAMEATYLRESVLPSLREENARLLKQIREMTQSSPRAGEGGGDQKNQPTPQAGRGFIERYKTNAPPVR